MVTTAEIGRAGEQVATEYLRQHGFLICEQNWRNGRYEIDIIATKWDTIHFVEVKTRRADGLTPPEAAITAAKFRALKHAASLYLALHTIDLEPYFDLCAVEYRMGEPPVIRYIEDAMESTW